MAPSARGLVLLFVLMATVSPSASLASGKGAASISGSFSDSCRDFASHSSKDISHAEIHYADSRVVKDESIETTSYSIDGGVGDEIVSAIMKSGQSTEQFDCAPAAGPPTAVLERKAGSYDQQLPEGSWTSTDCHYDGVNNTFCGYGLGVGEPSVSFRGTTSTDPDNDIVSWSIDFGDGTSTGGNWGTDPPTEVTHDYGAQGCICTVVLTVTDSAGHTNPDSMLVFLDDDGFD